jgi:hypothetical protein
MQAEINCFQEIEQQFLAMQCGFLTSACSSLIHKVAFMKATFMYGDTGPVDA